MYNITINIYAMYCTHVVTHVQYSFDLKLMIKAEQRSIDAVIMFYQRTKPELVR